MQFVGSGERTVPAVGWAVKETHVTTSLQGDDERNDCECARGSALALV